MSDRSTFQIVIDGYMGAALYSRVVDVVPFQDVSFHYWQTAGNVSGTLTVQASNQETADTDGYGTGSKNDIRAPGGVIKSSADPLNTYITQWVGLDAVIPTVSFTPPVLTSATAAKGMILVKSMGFKWMRVIFTPTSGTGTLQVSFQGHRNKESNK